MSTGIFHRTGSEKSYQKQSPVNTLLMFFFFFFLSLVYFLLFISVMCDDNNTAPILPPEAYQGRSEIPPLAVSEGRWRRGIGVLKPHPKASVNGASVFFSTGGEMCTYRCCRAEDTHQQKVSLNEKWKQTNKKKTSTSAVNHVHTGLCDTVWLAPSVWIKRENKAFRLWGATTDNSIKLQSILFIFGILVCSSLLQLISGFEVEIVGICAPPCSGLKRSCYTYSNPQPVDVWLLRHY